MDSRLLTANELGIRLEIVGGIPLWEAHPRTSTGRPSTASAPPSRRPKRKMVLHVRRDGARHGVSPLEIGLECGCRVVV